MRSMLVALIMLFVNVSSASSTTPAISVTGGSRGIAIPNSNHGAEFTPLAPIVITHLGLFDDDDDGFDIDYPIGIYRLSDSALLASGVLKAGTSDMLFDRFRYVDIPDVTLSVGDAYVVSFYTSTTHSDEMSDVPSTQALSINPAISYGPRRRFQGITFGLVLPSTRTIQSRVGPNFLFEVIPEPATATLLLCCVVPAVVRRRR